MYAAQVIDKYIAQKAGQHLGHVEALFEPENGLCKIIGVAVSEIAASEQPSSDAWKAVVSNFLEELAARPEDSKVEVVYATTRTFTLDQHSMLVELGFQVLGIFPNAPGMDPSRINGIAAYYMPGTLQRRTYSQLQLHAAVLPYYRSVRDQFEGTEAFWEDAVEQAPRASKQEQENQPILELIQAPRFVARNFERLKERRFLSGNFYPFQEPNAMVTDPDQKVEVFLKLVPEAGFATLIGERIDRPVNPPALYQRVGEIVKELGITYLEILNDAADVTGTECLIKAGFLPCAYFPAFKAHGEGRRDYVIFTRQAAKVPNAPDWVRPLYQEFLTHYRRLTAARGAE